MPCQESNRRLLRQIAVRCELMLEYVRELQAADDDDPNVLRSIDHHIRMLDHEFAKRRPL